MQFLHHQMELRKLAEQKHPDWCFVPDLISVVERISSMNNSMTHS